MEKNNKAEAPYLYNPISNAICSPVNFNSTWCTTQSVEVTTHWIRQLQLLRRNGQQKLVKEKRLVLHPICWRDRSQFSPHDTLRTITITVGNQTRILLRAPSISWGKTQTYFWKTRKNMRNIPGRWYLWFSWSNRVYWEHVGVHCKSVHDVVLPYESAQNELSPKNWQFV